MTDLKIKNAVHHGKRGHRYLADGQGLELQITCSGTRSWNYRYTIDGTTRRMGLGQYPEVSLGIAREKAAEARRLAKAGTDPLAHRDEAKEAAKAALAAEKARQERAKRSTFEAVAGNYIAVHGQGWRSASHRHQFGDTLARHVFPTLGATPVGTITADHVVEALRPIWRTRHATAVKLLGRIAAVLEFAAMEGLRDENAANPADARRVRARLGPGRAIGEHVRHRAALPWASLPNFFAELRARHGGYPSGDCLALTILTAVRTSEARCATWSEIDLTKHLWIIPAHRTKTLREHRVPLSDAAVELLLGVLPTGGPKPGDYVFLGAKSGQPLVIGAMRNLLLRMQTRWLDVHGKAVSIHGFRSTFRDWCADHDVQSDIAEAALAHRKRGVEGAYNRSDLLERRRAVMQRYADHVIGRSAATDGDNVLPLRAAAG